MPHFGLILTLDQPDKILHLLQEDQRVRVGERRGSRVSIAFSPDSDEELEALRTLPGVAQVDLVFADFSDRVDVRNGQ